MILPRTALLFALALAAAPLLFGAPPEESTSIFTGKVVPLKEVIEKSGGKLDRDAERYMVALVVEGKAYPIIKDDGGRRFFNDEKLFNKEYRIKGKLIGGTLLHVITVNGLKDGQLLDVYYWCDICAIRRLEKNDCECCGGPMELREEPVGK